MPSLWKKQKGNRISRLVADLQSPPKRGGSLVVETGFPTSIVDLFVKNRDRLKKPSKKKHRSKHPTSTTAPTPDQQSSSPSSPVSDPSVSFAKLEVPSWSVDEKNQEFDAQNNNSDLCVEELVTQKNPNVELNGDCCRDEVDERGNGGVLRPKNAIWLSVVKGALVVVIALYTKRFVVGITIGAFLLLLLEYVGNSVFRFLKPCEDAKRNLQGFSPGGDVTKPRLGVGEDNGDEVLKGVVQSALRVGSKSAKEGENAVNSKRTIEQEVGNTLISKSVTLKGIPSRKNFEQDVGKSVVSKSATLKGIASRRNFEQEVGNAVVSKSATLKGIASRKIIEQEDGNGGIPPRGVFEQGNAGTTITMRSSCSVEEVPNKSFGEIEEQKFCARPKNSSCCVPGGYCELGWGKGDIGGEGEKKGESSKLAKQKSKKRKGKKFWKKFVAKHIHKKRKHKQGKEEHRAGWGHEVPSLEEIRAELEEEIDQEEMVNGEGSSSSSSDDDDDEEWVGVEHLGFANHSCTDMSQADDRIAKSSGMLKKRGWNFKCLTIMGIALAGLVISRIFAVILTMICCLMFKMLRV